MATAKHNNRHGALGYEMGSGHIFQSELLGAKHFWKSGPWLFGAVPERNISILAIVQPALEIILHSYFSKA